MKTIRSFLVLGLFVSSLVLMTGCCGFDPCNPLPDPCAQKCNPCDPCAKKSNPCDPCAQPSPCDSPCGAPAAAPAEMAPAAEGAGAGCGAGGKSCG